MIASSSVSHSQAPSRTPTREPTGVSRLSNAKSRRKDHRCVASRHHLWQKEAGQFYVREARWLDYVGEHVGVYLVEAGRGGKPGAADDIRFIAAEERACIC